MHPQVVLYVSKNRQKTTRVGLTATKKVGGAVQRNRARRVMREALSQNLSQNVGGYDIILVARAQTPALKSTQLAKTVGKLLKKAGISPDALLDIQAYDGEIYITEAQLPELAADLIHLARLPEEGLRRLLASDRLL